MSEWKRCTVGDVCEVFDGPHATPPQSNDGPIYLGIPSIRSDGSIDYENSKRISYENYPKWTKRVTPQENDVVFSYEANLESYARIPAGFEGCLGRRMAIMRPDPSAIDARFLYYYTQSPAWKAVIASRTVLGATVNRIPIATFPEFPLRLPSLPAQQRIAGVLSAYDKLIENNCRQIKLLEEAAQRLYKEWFVDLRFPGNETTPIIDGIPEGWAKTTVGDLCLTVGGGTPSTKVASYYNGGDISWVTPTDVTGNLGIYLPKTAKMITGEGLENSSARMIPKGAILMTSRASIGYFAICETNVCTNQGFISSIPHDDDMKWVLLRNLQSRVDEMKGLAKGSTFLEISKAAFRAMPLTIPPKELAKRFSTISKELFTKEVLTRKQLEIAREARDRLLPKLMSGEIEV